MSSPNNSFTKDKKATTTINPKDISIRHAIRNATITHSTLDVERKRLKEENDELRNIIGQLKNNINELENKNDIINNELEQSNIQISRLTMYNNELNSKNQELQLEYEAVEVLLKESTETMKFLKSKLDLEKQIRLEQTQKATSLELRLVELTKRNEESYSDSYKRFIDDYNKNKTTTTKFDENSNVLPPAHKAIEQLLQMEETSYQRKLKIRDAMKQAVNQLCDRLVELEHVAAQVEPMLAIEKDETLSPVSSPQKDTIFGSPSFRYPISDLQLTESIYENENPNNSNNSQNINHIEESMITVESDI